MEAHLKSHSPVPLINLPTQESATSRAEENHSQMHRKEKGMIKEVCTILMHCSMLGDCFYAQARLAELKIPTKLKWKKGKDMPFPMSSPQSVVIGDNVYVGGGHSISGAAVVVYSLRSGTWKTLPLCETNHSFYGMAALNDQLVLVGGRNTASKRTGVLEVWDERSQTWTHPFPEMPTPRFSPSVVSYQKWLVVAGGMDQRDSYSRIIELLDIHTGQWYEGSPLPNACSGMSSAINGNMWYLSGRSSSRGSVFYVCLDELISQAVSQSAAATSPSTPSPWQTLTDSPLMHSTVLTFNGALLLVGGWKSSAIHLYQPSSRSWVKIGYLPSERWKCACTVLPSGEILIAGGQTRLFEASVGTNHVDICTIEQ